MITSPIRAISCSIGEMWYRFISRLENELYYYRRRLGERRERRRIYEHYHVHIRGKRCTRVCVYSYCLRVTHFNPFLLPNHRLNLCPQVSRDAHGRITGYEGDPYYRPLRGQPGYFGRGGSKCGKFKQGRRDHTIILYGWFLKRASAYHYCATHHDLHLHYRLRRNGHGYIVFHPCSENKQTDKLYDKI